MDKNINNPIRKDKIDLSKIGNTPLLSSCINHKTLNISKIIPNTSFTRANFFIELTPFIKQSIQLITVPFYVNSLNVNNVL